MTHAYIESNPPSYPAGGTYGELLTWHLCVWGTRPEQGRSRGKEWGTKDFAERVHKGEHSDPASWETSLNNWMTDAHQPKTKTRRERIELELFGAIEDIMLWRDDLRAAYKRRSFNKTMAVVSSPNIKSHTKINVGISDDVAANIVELVAIARKAGVFEQAANQGISEVAVRNIVERLGGEGIERNDLIAWLEGWIETANRQLQRESNEGIAFELARTEAKRRFCAGKVKDVSDPLIRLLNNNEYYSKEHRIAIIEEAIKYDALSGNLLNVIRNVKSIADIEGCHKPRDISVFLIKKGDLFYEFGKNGLYNINLLVSIYLYQQAIAELASEDKLSSWAWAQNNLGNSLQVLGERESGTQRLHQAVTAYRFALEERTRERVPLDWAATQNNLGNVLRVIGERENDTQRLYEAVVAFRLALNERTRDRVPLGWAATQNNLGNALLEIGERESDTQRLHQAVDAYSFALQEFTRERVPFKWAATQNNLGNALQALGKQESETQRLYEAVSAYRLALEERTRELVPLDWAMTKNNLGSALQVLGERESDTQRLHQAVMAYRLALEIRKRELIPLDWAETQSNLETALRILSRRENAK